MISAEAREVVEQSGANRRISMIVTIDPGDEMRSIATIPDFKERGAKLKMFFARKKEPLLDALSGYRSVGLRVVNNSSGAPNLIFSAPARVWKRVLREQPLLEGNSGIRVETDAPDVVSAGSPIKAGVRSSSRRRTTRGRATRQVTPV